MSVKEKFVAVINAIRNLWKIFSFFVRVSFYVFRCVLFSFFVAKRTRSSSSAAVGFPDDRSTSPADLDVFAGEMLMNAVNMMSSLLETDEFQQFKHLFLPLSQNNHKQKTIGHDGGPKPSFRDDDDGTEFLEWENVDDVSEEDAAQERIKMLNKIIGTVACRLGITDFSISLDSFSKADHIDDLDMVTDSVDCDNKIEEKSQTSSVVPVNKYPSIVDTNIDEDIIKCVGHVKKTNVQKVNQRSRTKENSGNLVSSNHIPIFEQNGTSTIQLQFSNESLDEFQTEIRNNVSCMEIDLGLLSNRVSQIELKLNEMREDIKNLVAK